MNRYKIFLGLFLVFALLTLTLWQFGEDAVPAARKILPAAWTAQGPDTQTVPLKKFGLDQFLRDALFGATSRRAIFFTLLGAVAVLSLAALGQILKGPPLTTEPRWRWSDLVWVTLGAVVFWEMIPMGEAVETGVLFLKDAAVCAWIAALGIARGLGPREFGIPPDRLLRDAGRGILGALLLLPALAVLVLVVIVRHGPSVIPTELSVPSPPSPAAAWLSILILPFLEEVLFRGFLYRLLRARWPEVLANLAVSFLFAAIHGTSGYIGAARFLGSLLMCRLYDRTGTLWSSLGAHATFNAILLAGPVLL